MTHKELSKPTCIDCGVAAKPLAGQGCSGDTHFVRELEHDALLAVIDGIGHGPQAARAAAVAVAELENSSSDEPLSQLMERCHRALIEKRGVAMTLVRIQFAENMVHWLGVGNVCGSLFVAEPLKQCWKALLPQSGIVGYQLPRLRVGKAPIGPGDWLVLTTDGVRGDFDEGIAMNGPPQQIAERILARHGKGNDDALVLAARYVGTGDE